MNIGAICTCLAPEIEYCAIHNPYNTESEKMNRQDLIKASAQATIERANRDIERAEKKLALINLMGEDVYADEDVLVFYKKFVRNPCNTYTYSAIKLGNWWFLSGPSQQHNKYDWGALVEFIIGQNEVEELIVWHATGWERVL